MLVRKALMKRYIWVFIEKNPHISGPTQFKSVLSESQPYYKFQSCSEIRFNCSHHKRELVISEATEVLTNTTMVTILWPYKSSTNQCTVLIKLNTCHISIISQ